MAKHTKPKAEPAAVVEPAVPLPDHPPPLEVTRVTAPPKTTLTWLGEGEDGPRFNEWNGIRFEVGKPVSEGVTPHMIAKARTNRFFEVGSAE